LKHSGPLGHGLITEIQIDHFDQVLSRSIPASLAIFGVAALDFRGSRFLKGYRGTGRSRSRASYLLRLRSFSGVRNT
jgi:hypothetical protein